MEITLVVDLEVWLTVVRYKIFIIGQFLKF